MRRVLRANDTEKPIGQLRQALADAGAAVSDAVAAAPAPGKAVASAQRRAWQPSRRFAVA